MVSVHRSAKVNEQCWERLRGQGQLSSGWACWLKGQPMPWVSLYILIQKSRSFCIGKLMQFNGSGGPGSGVGRWTIQRSTGVKPEATPLDFKCLTLDAPS